MNTGLKLMKFYVENVITNPTGSGLTETLISHFGDTKVFILNKKKKNVLTPIFISFYFQLTKLCDEQL